jgi:hypothetical protein
MWLLTELHDNVHESWINKLTVLITKKYSSMILPQVTSPVIVHTCKHVYSVIIEYSRKRRTSHILYVPE